MGPVGAAVHCGVGSGGGRGGWWGGSVLGFGGAPSCCSLAELGSVAVY